MARLDEPQSAATGGNWDLTSRFEGVSQSLEILPYGHRPGPFLEVSANTLNLGSRTPRVQQSPAPEITGETMSFRTHRCSLCLGWITALGWASLALTVCAEPIPSRVIRQQDSPTAATIDERGSISVREVDQLVSAIAQEEQLSPALREQMRTTALQQLIGRRIILSYLEKKQMAATSTDIQTYVSQLKTKLTNQNIRWDTFLDRIGLSEKEFENSVKWKLSWDNYLRLRLTEENLQKYFDQNRRHFDGTELKVSQILIKLPMNVDPTKVKDAVDRLQKIKQEIEQGKMTFAEAAKEYSEAESGSNGGQLGRIPRQSAMPEAFSKTAFDLNPQQVSQPVVTNIGVHLVLCEEVFPGQTSRDEVEDKVRRAATRYLFDWIVKEERGDHKIQILRSAPPN